ncbi:hypothetical protein ACFX1Q_010451 [Malus domestica]
MLTNDSQEIKGHAFYPNPVTFKNSYSDTNAFSFSTTFVFAIRSLLATVSGHGMAFVIAPKRGIPQALHSPFLGLFNPTNNGNVTNHIFAVELDTIKQIEFNDIDNNHVGIDINGLNSVKSATAGYYAENNGGFWNLPSLVVNFKMNGQAQELVHSQLPNLPRIGGKKVSKLLTIGVPVMSLSLVLVPIVGMISAIRRKRKFAELLEDWELEGILPASKTEVAVKKVSHESRQGMKEFVAEVVSIGRLPATLNWSLRFKVIRGVASGLFYLHEEWEQVVVHRDVKASNVLLDGELNARLGDFGLARLYDHGTDLQTTHIVGTLGYLAPKHTRSGRATTHTDVFAFGAFLLEVAWKNANRAKRSSSGCDFGQLGVFLLEEKQYS